jgi:hypothetical protein
LAATAYERGSRPGCRDSGTRPRPAAGAIGATTGSTNYFLVAYDVSTGGLQVEEYDSASATAAEYSVRERQYRDRPEIEVVLVGADSLETVKKTHSHYFSVPTEALMAGG